jgi:hypothetical protein
MKQILRVGGGGARVARSSRRCILALARRLPERLPNIGTTETAQGNSWPFFPLPGVERFLSKPA